MSNLYDLSPEPVPPKPQRPTGMPPSPGAGQPGWGRPPTLGYANPRTIYGTPLPNGWRATTSAVLAVVLALLNGAQVPLEIWDSRQLSAALAGTLTTAEEARLGTAYLALGALYLLLLVPFLVFFFMWLYRAVKNIRITTGDSRSGPGMSVGWWFIPIANLFMPYLVLKDLSERARIPAATTVGVFWTLWIGSGIADRITSRVYQYAITQGDLELAQGTIPFSIAAAVAAGAAYLLLAKIIHDVQHRQEPLAR